MKNAIRPNHKYQHWWSIRAAVLCVVTILGAYVASNRSYQVSDSLTFLDVTICADEGLLSLQIPLVLRSPSHTPSNQLVSYVREPKMWDAPAGGGKATLRNWMSILDKTHCEGGMICGFGYWKGSWQSDSRPGPFLVVFVPIWVATVAVSVLTAILFLRRLRIRLLTMLIATTCIAVVLSLLTLLADH